MKKIEKLCEVCGQSMKHGPHKHILKYCPKCRKTTEHTTPFFGLPFYCNDPRHDDLARCYKCGRFLDGKTIKVAKALGATKILCRQCTKTTKHL